MTTRIRGALRPLAYGTIALLLAGCVKVDMDLEISPDNTVSGQAILAVDQSLVELSGQTADQLFKDLDLSDLPEGATVEPYEGDGFVGQQVNFDDVALSEFTGGETLGASGEELSITRVGDEFHVEGRLDMSGTEFSGGQVPQQVLDTMEFRIAITFPGPVESSTGSVEGNTVTWEPRIGQNTEIRAVASAIPSGGSPWLLTALVAAGALILGAVLFLLVGRKRPAPAEGPIEGVPAVVDQRAVAGPVEETPAVPTTAPQPPPPPGDPAPVEPPPPATTGGDTTDDGEGSPPPVPPVSG
jgi:phosphatidylinositol mannoside-binding LppM-like protein